MSWVIIHRRLDCGQRVLIKTPSRTTHFSDTIFQYYDNIQETRLCRYDIHLILQPSDTTTAAPHYYVFSLQKYLVRSPISQEINSLSVSIGKSNLESFECICGTSNLRNQKEKETAINTNRSLPLFLNSWQCTDSRDITEPKWVIKWWKHLWQRARKIEANVKVT